MKQRKKKKIFLLVLLGALIIVAIFVIRFFSLFWGVVVDKNIQIKKNEQGMVNILLLGIGGGAHDGPNLTDTIILASLDPKKNTVNLISIPRDLYIPALKGKINRVYSDGEEKGKGNGILLVKSAINSVTGIKPDYAVVIDFSGFVKLVDLLGGIEVIVKNPLTDYEYPVTGLENELCGYEEDGIASFSAQISTGSATEPEIFPCRYETLHVDAGEVHMDGELALKFVRSRHAIGEEGTDFARSARQQAVINAVRTKVLSLGTLTNPVRIFGIIDILTDHIKMDIAENEIDDFIKLAQKMKDARITNYVLDMGDERSSRPGLLIHPDISAEYGFQWVLAPRLGRDDFSEIKEYIMCIILGKNCEVTERAVIVSEPNK